MHANQCHHYGASVHKLYLPQLEGSSPECGADLGEGSHRCCHIPGTVEGR